MKTKFQTCTVKKNMIIKLSVVFFFHFSCSFDLRTRMFSTLFRIIIIFLDVGYLIFKNLVLEPFSSFSTNIILFHINH